MRGRGNLAFAERPSSAAPRHLLPPGEGAEVPAHRSFTDYVSLLESIDRALLAKRNAEAHDIATQLRGAIIESPSGNFTADASLLDDVINNRAGAETRVALAVAELRKAAPNAAPAIDAKLLERLRAQQSGGELKAGGEVSAPLGDQPMVQRAADTIQKWIDWLDEKFEKLGRWLLRFWPSSRSSADDSSPSAVRTRWIVSAVVVGIVIVLVILAWEVVRRSRGRKIEPVMASEPLSSKRDEDPLSRGASEWERYAAQLAASGRVREAIRAWYHAVLVTCYGGGILHFRKGRTNWEYVGALSPELAWRGDFVQLTRRFEEEWYGRETSTRDALDECSSLAKHILDALHRREAAA
jgi:hypothetical protein